MPLRPPTLLGMVIGLTAAMLVLGYASMHRDETGAKMLPDEGGPIGAVVMQYTHGSEAVAPVYHDFLKWQGPQVTVYLACPEERDFMEIKGLLGDAGGYRMVPVYTHHEMTSWARDRWVALTPEARDSAALPVTLLSPKGELAQEVWPERAGDSQIGGDLAKAFPDRFLARRSALYFDGGDYLADGAYVFATRAVIERNVQHTVTSRENLLQAIAHDLHRTPILMDDGPLHHAGMFMMSAGPASDGSDKRVMIVADPSLGRRDYSASAENDGYFTEGPDFSPETQKRFDVVASLCEKTGYRVVRIPVVPARAGKMYMTYVNVILERRGEKSIVYMSTYGGQERMNAAATAVWESLGYEVRPVDCTTVWQRGGTLHCLVNVFQRR